jgi:branched-subunit amino acid aminotransferase/4-amino-4-deoxychorismate lyase
MSALEHMLRFQNKEYHVENLNISHLNEADEIFFINAVDGIVPLQHWQNKKLSILESKKIALDFQSFYYF